MIVTTTPTVEGHSIKEYKGLVSGEVIFGMNFLKDIGASLRDFFGGRTNSYEQAMLEARIVTIEATLKNAVIIDEEGVSNEHVHVGCKVKILNLNNNTEATYKIVGSNESNPAKGRISDESPVGMALMGHSIGDVVEVEVPVGVIGFKVLDIFK